MSCYVIPFQQLRMTDVDRVGGKNASLGEMISQLTAAGVRVPGGFATTAQAYRDFLAHQGLANRIHAALEKLDVDDVIALVDTGAQIRRWISETPFPPRLEDDLRTHYERLVAEGEGTFAVRSSATAEDLPDASFAGQQETFLNISDFENILHAMREMFTSLYSDRAIPIACTRVSSPPKSPCRPGCSAWCVRTWVRRA
jgi:pyruvate,water dikinase